MRRHRSGGYSLIELVVSLGVGTILMTALLQFFVGGVRSLSSYSEQADAVLNSKMGLEVMLRDIRMAGFDPTGLAGAALVEGETDRLRLTADLNGDGDLGDAGEDVEYAVVDVDQDGVPELGRSVDGGRSYDAVVGYVSRLSFSYLLEDGTRSSTAESAEKLRGVAIGLECFVASRPEETVSATGTARVRNLGRREND